MHNNVINRLRSESAIVAIVASLFGLLVSLVSPVLTDESSLGIEESVGLDMLYTLRRPAEPLANVIVLALSNEAGVRLGLEEALEDEKELKGWPRHLHAQLLDIFSGLGVRAVVFDVFFNSDGVAEDDQTLAVAIEAFEATGDVLLFEGLDREEEFLDDDLPAASFRMVSDHPDPPIELLDRPARGSVTFPLPDTRGAVNRYWTFVDQADGTPSLPVAAFALYAESSHDSLLRYLRSALPDAQLDEGTDLGELMASVRRLALSNPDVFAAFEPGDDRHAATLRDLYTEPVSNYINYYGPPMSIRTVRADQVLLDGPDPRLPWQDAIVFVGFSERAQSSQQDEFNSFYSQSTGLRLSGVEIGATVLSNLIEGRTLRVLPIWLQFGVVIVVGVLLGMLFRLRSTTYVMVGMTLLLVVYVILARQAFMLEAVWMPLAVPLLIQAPLALIAGLLLRHSHAEARRSAVTVGASRYLPSELVARISENPDAASRSTDLVYGTCMVTDIEQYTSHSEALAPRELEETLNRYYDRLFEIIAAHGGLVTDIVGDSMVAVWRDTADSTPVGSAPLAAALTIRRQFTGDEAGYWRTRIGLHEGEFVLGTVGAQEHLEYRAVGDTVNTAARVQSLNKILGTLALATTDSLVDERIGWRPLGRFLLAGKQIPVEVGEPLAFSEGLSEHQQGLIKDSTEALRLLGQQKSRESLKLFRQILRHYPQDGPAAFYVGHIEAILAGSRSADPDGVIHIAA